MRSSLALLLCAGLAACSMPATRPDAPAGPPGTGLYTQSFGNTPARQVRTLIVVLHGDAPATKPDYHYAFARAAADAVPNSIAVALLRPGYEDPQGHRSPGERGQTTGDNYTPDRIAAVAETIRHLQHRYGQARTVLVGHSGGAAIAADLLGSRKGGADAALLVSCPCDLDAWRDHMHTVQGGAIWQRPVRSLSPIREVDGVPPSTRITMLVGSQDDVAPPPLTQAYAEALRKHGVTVGADVVEGLPHDILLEPVVIDRLRELVDAVRAPR